MGKSLFSAMAALAVAGLVPSAAGAVTIYDSYSFDLSNGHDLVSSSSGVGNAFVFRSTSDPRLQVKITAWSIDKQGRGSDDDIVTAATLHLYSGGLGVQNKYEDGSSPNHSMDNGTDYSGRGRDRDSHSMVDFVLLQFNYDVDLNTFDTGWVSGDQDASLRMGLGPISNPALWQNTPSLNGKPYDDGNAATTTDLTNYLDVPIADSKSSSSRSQNGRRVNGDDEHGMVWLLGALYGSDNNDYFKLDGLNVTVFPTVPEPSTWLTMILGFGFIGGTMRRRKASLGKASALA
jgi:hypothetical protein